MLRSLTIVFLFSAAAMTAAAAQSATSEDAIRRIVSGQVTAWNAGDGNT
jgi:hypothetical protein